MQKDARKKIAVGLSGGVDSSVSAYLLKEQGHDIVGVYIKCWEQHSDGCVSDADKNDAIKVCATLDIKFEYLDFTKQYKEKVIEYFYGEYKAGRTPNPDVVCNKEIKFGLFMNWALDHGFDAIATGHYAQIKKIPDGYQLLKGVDVGKDQSYFLYSLDQGQLSKTIFPVGHLRKKQVRELAKKAGLSTYNKPDSVGICFIGEIDIKEFLKKYIKEEKGKVLNVNGDVIGEHDGVWFYTIGQRHGFKVHNYVGTPLYIVGKNISKNELVVGSVIEASKQSFEVSNLHWISGMEFPGKCGVRIRHLGKIYPAKINFISADKLCVQLKTPVFGVAAGQAAVFYDKAIALGGGIIL